MRSSNENDLIMSLKLRTKNPAIQRNMLCDPGRIKARKLQVLDQPAGLHDNYETTGDYGMNVIDEVKVGMDMTYDDKIVHGTSYPTGIGQWKGQYLKYSPRDRNRQKATLVMRRAQAKRKSKHLVTICIKRIGVFASTKWGTAMSN